MFPVAHTLALIATAAGVLVLFAAVLGRAPWRSAVGMMLDLWTAAGLLELTPEKTSWKALCIAALLIGLRHLVMWSLRSAPEAHRVLRSWRVRRVRPG